jgi:hypothetical protein
MVKGLLGEKDLRGHICGGIQREEIHVLGSSRIFARDSRWKNKDISLALKCKIVLIDNGGVTEVAINLNRDESEVNCHSCLI